MNNKVLQMNVDQFVGGRHKVRNVEDLVPFTSSKSNRVLRNKFSSVIGSLARSITNKEVIKISPEYEYHPETQALSNFIAESPSIEFENEDDIVDFVRLVDSFLFEETELQIKHPYLYNLKGGTEKKSDFQNTSNFIEQIFFKEEPEILTIFQLSETNHVLLNMILTRVDEVMKVEKSTTSKDSYANLLPYLTSVFIEDLRFLKKHGEYFLKNLELFLNYYMFTYPIQLLYKLELFAQDDEQVKPYYYALEWEQISKKRPVSHPFDGYKFVTDRSSNLFVHQQVLQQLSINVMNEDKEIKPILSYTKLFKEIESRGEDYEARFVEDLKEWIVTYSTEFTKLTVPSLASTKEKLVEQLFGQVSQGMSETSRKRFGDKIRDLGVNQFLKQRGNLGYLFNMNYDLLMLLTAVIVKDQPMPFKEVLEGFKQRGIVFDRHSIAHIIELFNKQNILDNKSDSGDAQYVKPIL